MMKMGCSMYQYTTATGKTLVSIWKYPEIEL